MKHLLILSFAIVLFSCSSERNPQIITLLDELISSNQLIKISNEKQTQQARKTYLLYSKNAHELHSKVVNLLNKYYTFNKLIDSVVTLENLKEDDFLAVVQNYEMIYDSTFYFANNQQLWSVNDYRLAKSDFNNTHIDNRLFAVIRMQNDILIVESQLLDYVLFYFECKCFKGNHLRIKISKDFQFSTKENLVLNFNTEVTTIREDTISKIIIDTLLINNKLQELGTLNLDVKISTKHNSASIGSFILKKKKAGNYQITGRVIAKSMYSSDNDFWIELPFSYEFTVK